MSKAIILVAFGSTNLEGIKKSIGLLESDLNKYFGDEYTITKAFTSNKIIKLLKERHDYVVPHLSKALFNLSNHGYEEIIIQPLHIMSNNDIIQIKEIVEEYKYSVNKLIVSKALFTDDKEKLFEECYEIAKIICEDLGDNDVLLVGHGSKRSSNNLYYVIEEAVKEVCNKRVYMATLEGEETIDKVITQLKQDSIKNITLQLLFIIPGKHVINDILNGENSWINEIKSIGVTVNVSNYSLLQYREIREKYIARINDSLKLNNI